jgi:hypothetical protein
VTQPLPHLTADLDQVALAVQASPGVFALLLGSGVSRAAAIPTGLQILDDLIRRCALAAREPEPADPRAWYEARFGEPAGYSSVLARLGPTPAARRDLLRSYFEPTPDERERGLKVPTAAHHAIARLVERGHIRVIVTTNFDRLLESALMERGIAPSVIASPDDVDGAMPLAHARCTIIKVHGDYLDARIRNTGDELERYPPRLARIVRQVFDEYGLIVSGWSADWDRALRDLLAGTSSRRFPLFWCGRHPAKDASRALIDLRGGVEVRIQGAEHLFSELAERVAALDARGAASDLSLDVVRERVKRYIVDPAAVVRLSDLVGALLTDAIPAVRGLATAEDATPDLVRRHEWVAAPLVVAMVHGCHWGGPEHLGTWWRVLQSLGGLRRDDGSDALRRLVRYPAQLALVAGCLGAFAGGRLQTLAMLLGAPVRDGSDTTTASVLLTRDGGVDPSLAQATQLADGATAASPAPASDRRAAVLRDELLPYLPALDIYEDVFDEVEHLLALTVASRLEATSPDAIPVGRYLWRSWDVTRAMVERRAGELVDAGLFASPQVLEAAQARVAANRERLVAATR